MFHSFLNLAVVVIFSLLVTPSLAHEQVLANCSDRASALSSLLRTHKERPVAMGLSSTGAVIEVLTNEEGSSWSILVTVPSGITCLLIAGESWETLRLN